jgi:hypothetical protein
MNLVKKKWFRRRPSRRKLLLLRRQWRNRNHPLMNLLKKKWSRRRRLLLERTLISHRRARTRNRRWRLKVKNLVKRKCQWERCLLDHRTRMRLKTSLRRKWSRRTTQVRHSKPKWVDWALMPVRMISGTGSRRLQEWKWPMWNYWLCPMVDQRELLLWEWTQEKTWMQC